MKKWFIVDDCTTKNGRIDTEKLETMDKNEAIELAQAAYTRLTTHDKRLRDAFYVAFAEEDEDGYMSFENGDIEETVDIKVATNEDN